MCVYLELLLLFFNLSWHATSDIFKIKIKIKIKPLVMLAFSIQTLNGKDYFDTRLKG